MSYRLTKFRQLRDLVSALRENSSGAYAGYLMKGYRGLVIPSTFMREESVEGFIPSIDAAPLSPDTRQSHAFSARTMLSCSNCWISVMVRIRSDESRFGRVAGRGVRLASGNARSRFSSASCAVMIARSMTFCNSRIFPGHAYD